MSWGAGLLADVRLWLEIEHRLSLRLRLRLGMRPSLRRRTRHKLKPHLHSVLLAVLDSTALPEIQIYPLTFQFISDLDLSIKPFIVYNPIAKHPASIQRESIISIKETR
jgi:hypothetical protein